MKIKNSVLRFTVVLLAIGLFVYLAGMTAFALSGKATGLVYEKKDYAVSAAEIRKVIVRARNMPVRVTPSGSDKIMLRYSTCKEDPYEVSLDSGVLTLAYKNDVLTNFSNWVSGIFRVFSNPNPEVDMVLPTAYAGDLSLNTSNAAMNVSGLTAAGEVRVESSNSGIQVSSISAALLDARTSNGAVTLDKVTISGTADIRSSNGTLSARETVARDRLRMETSNGRVTVNQVASADINLRSSNGSVTGSVEGKRADYSISSHASNGDDSLGDGGKGQLRLTVQTSNGNIDIRFLGE